MGDVPWEVSLGCDVGVDDFEGFLPPESSEWVGGCGLRPVMVQGNVDAEVVDEEAGGQVGVAKCDTVFLQDEVPRRFAHVVPRPVALDFVADDESFE